MFAKIKNIEDVRPSHWLFQNKKTEINIRNSYLGITLFVNYDFYQLVYFSIVWLQTILYIDISCLNVRNEIVLFTWMKQYVFATYENVLRFVAM